MIQEGVSMWRPFLLPFCLYACIGEPKEPSLNISVPPGDGENEDVQDMDQDDDGYAIDEGDCDDENPAVHPGATEVCDGGVGQRLRWSG